MSRRVFSKIRGIHSKRTSLWSWRSGYKGGESELESFDSRLHTAPWQSGVGNKGTVINCTLDIEGSGTIKVTRNGVVLYDVTLRAENPSALERDLKEVDVKVSPTTTNP